jgi:uncharacterized Zn-binding protein involved in type VI secretion
MPSHVLVNSLGLTYKSTIGISIATLPDVCKTPSPGGPVPIPYPNIADQGSLDKGSTTVKAKGKMVAIKGSEYSRSNGDEAGTAGGVTSSTNMKETSWISYSFDVKMDGQNACRHTDKKFHNHKNTVDLAGNADPVLDKCTKKGLEKLADECNKKINCDEGVCPAGPSGQTCTTLGTKKHKCCEDAIKKHAAANPNCGMESEVAYDKDTGEKQDKEKAAEARSEANKAYNAEKAKNGIQSCRDNNTWWEAFKAAGGGNTFIADVVMKQAAYDFKFNCREVGDNPTADRISETQSDMYKTYTGFNVKAIAKDGRDCTGC